MAGIIINRGNGGLGRTLPELDYVSGFITYNDNKPVTYASGSTKAYNNMIEVEADGIVKDSIEYSYEWMHLDEYFRTQPNGKVYTHFAPASGSLPHNYQEVIDIQKDAKGEIRNLGILATNTPLATTELDKVQVHCDTLEEAKTPLQVVMSFNYDAITEIEDLPDLSTMATPARNVSVCISQDGDNYGYSLSSTNNACLGATLGLMSLANVQESIGWVEKFNIASTELESPILAFGGIKYEDISSTDIEKLNDRRYLYLKKYSDVIGTYYNTDPSADAITSDYNSIHLNRVFHKALRKIYQSLVPLINSPVRLKNGGLLTPGGVDVYEKTASKPMNEMVAAGEISNYNVNVPNETNLLVDPTIYIEVRLLPYGVSEEIVVTLGFTAEV